MKEKPSPLFVKNHIAYWVTVAKIVFTNPQDMSVSQVEKIFETWNGAVSTFVS